MTGNSKMAACCTLLQNLAVGTHSNHQTRNVSVQISRWECRFIVRRCAIEMMWKFDGETPRVILARNLLGRVSATFHKLTKNLDRGGFR